MNRAKNLKNLFTALAIFAMIGGILPPTTIAGTSNSIEGFDRGVSWKPYVSLKRATFVQFDGESYLDDYAYLASVPTAVFYDKNTDQIYTNPLLFYQDAYPVKDDKERILDAYPGIDYFMEDWMAYCNGKLDQMTLINVPKNKLDSNWDSKNYSLIEGNDPYDIANKIALNDWSYSDSAIIAVVKENYEKPVNKISGKLQDSLPFKEVLTEHFEIPKTNEVYPIYNEFSVPEGYKLLKVRSWYPCFYLKIPNASNMSIPSGDRDLQIYCKKDGRWMMAGITSSWNALEGMDTDKTSVYVYNSGKWSIALTDAPTKGKSESVLPAGNTGKAVSDVEKHHSLFGLEFGRYGRIIDILKNMRKVTYQVDVEMYPGVTVDIPDTPPFGCKDAYINLKWDDPSVSLGFSLIGPSGEEVLSTRDVGVSSTCGLPEDNTVIPIPSRSETDVHVHQLGECLPGEHYSICVFAINEIKEDVDFTIEYSWQQNTSRMEGDCLASATEGAVLASLLNAPLLYTDTSEVSSATVDTLYKLGVKNLFVVDLGGYLSSKANEQLSEIATIQTHFTKYDDIYSYIRKITEKNDVIFSTISPWTYWYTSESRDAVEIAGEMPGALSIGPAAYIAAHHGSPVLLVENHPELSSALVWHTEFWRRHPDGLSKMPMVSEMYLTGNRIYDFLKNHGFDQEGDEVIITVGGQFEIGLSWDRVFVGKGMPGRFIDSPIDISVWISKTVFYPQIVFENPAIKNSNGVALINGSSSERRFPWRGKLGLKITKASGEETFRYPVLETFVCYDHKFNTRASAYWGFTYTCADGTTPGVTPSLESIDAGVMEAVNGQKGGFLPDLSASEVQPFYLKKAGYQPVFSTDFEANMFNLKAGVLLWMINTHGNSADGGELMFWNAEAGVGSVSIPFAAYTKDTNPWRAYEWLLGSTEEPDTMTMETHGILSALAGNPNPKGIRLFSTGLDWALAKRPIRDIIGKIFNLPILRLFAPAWLKNTQDYYDGIVISLLLSRFSTSWYNGTQIDDALGNIHSVGISSVACLPAGKYLQLTLMRHGSVFQIMDPWATSWYSDVWQNSVPRGIALGKTIGEIYSEGISKVGILYISEPPQWWWDLAENVCLYGDPNLRIWAPSTEYSAMNHWASQDVESLRYDSREGFSVDGHMPFGVTSYPHAREPASWFNQIWIMLAIVVLALVVIFAVFTRKRKR